MGAEDVPESLVPALPDQVEVELADGGGERVGVVGDPVGPAVVARLDAVALVAGDVRALPDARTDVGQFDACTGVEYRRDA